MRERKGPSIKNNQANKENSAKNSTDKIIRISQPISLLEQLVELTGDTIYNSLPSTNETYSIAHYNDLKEHIKII